MSMGVPGGYVPRAQFDQLARHVRTMSDHMQAMKQMADEQAKDIIRLNTIEKVLNKLPAVADGGYASRANAPMVRDRQKGYLVDIDQLPGKRIPFDLLTDIAIKDGQMDGCTGTLQIGIEGPFVAVARVAIFKSQYQFRVSGSTVAAFQGRSFGRYRPIHSAADIADGLRVWEQPNAYQPAYLGAVTYDDSGSQAFVPIANPMGVHGPAGTDGSSTVDLTNMIPNFPGSGRPLNVSPVTMASFRTMEMDATIAVQVAGANFRRQSQPVPSAFWTKLHNEPWDLASSDVFEPGEAVTINVYPNHPNNPAYGNINGLAFQQNDFTFDDTTGGGTNDPMPVGSATGGYPFIAGQFDAHEGINSETADGDSADDSDPITRDASGILSIGYIGYMIVQAPMV